jgi:phosphatidylserine/phosphatidylglycerophosphate/cardiolipin synthase-like enzyme
VRVAGEPPEGAVARPRPARDRQERGRDPALRVRIVVNVHRRGAPGSPRELVDRVARQFWRTNWPFHARPDVYYLCEGEPGKVVAAPRIHAKLVVVDERVAYVGSANFTTAAFRHNLEAGVRIRDESVAHQLATYLERLIATGGLGALPG